MTMKNPAPLKPQRPLWKRLLLRRLKFIGWIVAILAIVLGGSYLFAPQWLMMANFMRQAMAANLEKHSVQAGDTRWVYYEGGQGQTTIVLAARFRRQQGGVAGRGQVADAAFPPDHSRSARLGRVQPCAECQL